jgi:hypothetical protein
LRPANDRSTKHGRIAARLLGVLGGSAEDRTHLPSRLPLADFVILVPIASEMPAFTAVGLATTWGAAERTS